MSPRHVFSPVCACVTLSVSLLLGGCTTWVKPGAGPAELNMATTHCEAVSYATLPSNTVTQTHLGASYSDRKKCEKNSSNGCVKKDGRYYAVIRTTDDTNSYGRSTIFRDCMMQNGWHPE